MTHILENGLNSEITPLPKTPRKQENHISPSSLSTWIRTTTYLALHLIEGCRSIHCTHRGKHSRATHLSIQFVDLGQDNHVLGLASRRGIQRHQFLHVTMRQSHRTHASKLWTHRYTIVPARDHESVPLYTRLKVRPRGTRHILHVGVDHFLLAYARPNQQLRDCMSQCSRMCVCSLDDICRLLLTRNNEPACVHRCLRRQHINFYTPCLLSKVRAESQPGETRPA